jgi:predicted TIM-barrel fold metal-dependent hydrolase
MPPTAETVPVSVIDCDVHPVPRSLDEFIEHFPEPFRSRYFAKNRQDVPLGFLLYTPIDTITTKSGMSGAGGYASPGPGMGAGSDPDFLARQLCVEHGTDYCIMNPLFFRPRHWNPEWDNAHASAVNSWLAANWLEGDANRHGRYFGALQVAASDPEGAAREIEKWAGHPAFIQTYLLADTDAPFGHPKFAPIIEATARHGLALGTHLFRHPSTRSMTPVGFPSYHAEVLPNWIFSYMAHVVSLVFSGVFEKHPDLSFFGVEGGCEWIGPLMWRMDRQWEALGAEIPQCTRPPSEVIREHVRIATQPICEPKRRSDLLRFMEWGAAEEVIVFSSDYPHYDFDSAAWLAPQLPESWRHRLMAGNALSAYGLPAERPRDYLDDMVIENPRMEAGTRRYEALAAVGGGGEDMLWDSAIESFD